MAQNTTSVETGNDGNPFLNQAGLLNLHGQARSAFAETTHSERKAHLKYAMMALLTLAERFGPTSEYLDYRDSVTSAESK